MSSFLLCACNIKNSMNSNQPKEVALHGLSGTVSPISGFTASADDGCSRAGK